MGRTSRFIEKNLVGPAVKKEMKGVKADLKKVLQESKNNKKTKELDLTPSGGLSAFFASQSYLDADPGDLLSRYFGWVYACIKVIADYVAMIDLKLMQVKSNGDVVEVESSEILDILTEFNKDVTFSDAIRLMITQKLLTGDAYWLLVYNGKAIDQIRSIRPSWVTIVPGDYRKGEFVKGYKIQVPGKSPQDIEPKEIIHFKNIHPQNDLYGLGVVEAALKTVNLEYTSEEWNNLFFKNAASTGSVISFPETISQENIDRIRHAMQQEYTGLPKAHKTLILSDGAQYQESGRTARDMEFSNMQMWVRDKVMAMFHVSKPILGITEDVNRANAEAAEVGFIRRVVMPEMTQMVDILNEQLLPRIPGTEDLFFDFQDPTPPDQETITRRTQALGTILTVNELRAEAGYDDIGPEGEFIYVNTQTVPLGTPLPEAVPATTADQAQKSLVKIPATSKKKSVLSSYGKRQYKRLKASKRYRYYVIMKEQITSAASDAIVKMKAMKKTDKNMDVFWQTMVDGTRGYILKVTGEMRKYIESEGNRVVRAYLKKTDGVRSIKSLEDVEVKALGDLINDPSKFFAIKKVLFETLGSINKKQGKQAFDFLNSQKPTGIKEAYDYNAGVQTQISQNIEQFLRSGGEYRESVVRKTLAKAVEDGLTVDETARLLKSTYQRLSINESRRIARTEVIRSSNMANLEAWQQSGVVIGKQWYTAADERVDQELCAPLHGTIIPVEDNFFDLGDTVKMTTSDGQVKTFNFDYSDVPTPPLHVNCRCTILPITSGLTVEQLTFPFDQPIKSFDDLEMTKGEEKFVKENNVKFLNRKINEKGTVGKYVNGTIIVGNGKKETVYHELGHAIFDKIGVSDEIIEKESQEIILHRIMNSNDFTKEQTKDLLFVLSGGEVGPKNLNLSNYLEYASQPSEIAADAYAQFKNNPKAFKLYAPQFYKLFKEII